MHANENISPLASSINFRYYKAPAYDKYPPSLQAAKISFVEESGIRIPRWGAVLTCRLEKVFGIIYIDKLRVICLLEVNYNRLNKLIFEKRRIDQAYESSQILPE